MIVDIDPLVGTDIPQGARRDGNEGREIHIGTAVFVVYSGVNQVEGELEKNCGLDGGTLQGAGQIRAKRVSCSHD